MKLNHECVRDLLLFIEDALEYGTYANAERIVLKDYSKNVIVYTADKLLEAGYIGGSRHEYSGHDNLPSIGISSITWEGHKFLDSIRDDSVWKNTKNILSGFSSVSLGIVSNVASQVISHIIKQQTGF